MSYVNAHQRMTSAEETFNNQIDRVVDSVDTSQPLSVANPVTAYWAHKVARVAGMEIMS